MINILSKETIDKIAAGEVAERPESVVKELLDNSIDSGADSISIEIRNGGLDLIRVSDNGSGIEKNDVRNAFLRHATSKLKTAEDIEHIRSMGFRGEALASIAAVSEVELITKHKNELIGTQYRIDGGAEKSFKEIGVPTGTTIIVRNFLLNVPVRRRFLKSTQVETSYIVNTVEKLALAYTNIAFSLNVDGKNIFQSTGSGRLRDNIYIIYGQETAASLLEVDSDRLDIGDKENAKLSGIHIKGYAARPVIAKSRRDYEVFFVNGRWIKSDILKKAAEDAYKPYMMQHKYPMFVLSVNVEPEEVDVNVHPRKSEVRFSSNQRIYDAVYTCLREVLHNAELVVNAGNAYFLNNKPERSAESVKKAPEPFEQKRKFEYVSSITEEIDKAETKSVDKDAGSLHSEYGKAADTALPNTSEMTASKLYKEDPAPSYSMQDRFKISTDFAVNDAVIGTGDKPAAVPAKGAESSKATSEKVFINAKNAPYFKLIGQVFETYWIIEYNDEMYMIDQHAAHEKVNYEKFMALINSHAVESQMIYPPIVLSLNAKEAVLFDKYLDEFTDMGYEIEYAGDRDYIVRAVPSNLPQLADEEVLHSLIDGLFEEGRRLDSELIRDKIASMSCKAAIKGNMKIGEQEMRGLISKLLTLDNPYACPHGRPTIIKWSRSDIERLFKRIVN